MKKSLELQRMEKRYWVVLIMPIFLLALYITTSMHHWLWEPLGPHLNQEYELRTNLQALSLLKQQNAELHSLSNSTTSIQKADILEQIRLNQEVQQILLSGHHNGTLREPIEGSAPYRPNNELMSVWRCKEVRKEAIVKNPGVEWRPKAGRFLVMICDSGQMTNHFICLQKHVYFGALLNRTLVLPHEDLDYKYEHLLDITHMKKCLGNNRVMTFKEFEAIREKNLYINTLICYLHDCYFDKDHQRKWETLGFTFGPRRDAWPYHTGLLHPATHTHPHDILTKFSSEEEVIATGDLYYAEFKDSAVAHVCLNLFQPHRSIIVTAQRFVQTYLGTSFLSLHFRRHGFLLFCNKKIPNCFFPIPQAAECIQKTIQVSNPKLIFLSTDAPESEIKELRSMVSVPLVMRSEAHEAQAKWDSLLWRKKLESDPAVMAMVDKAIAAMGTVFVGTRGSTFSDDIQRMRNESGTANSCDCNLCDGELPSFTAELP